MGNRTIVTGASGAMGEAAVRALAREGRSVVMACRNLEKAEVVRSRILADLPGADISIGRLDREAGFGHAGHPGIRIGASPGSLRIVIYLVPFDDLGRAREIERFNFTSENGGLLDMAYGPMLEIPEPECVDTLRGQRNDAHREEQDAYFNFFHNQATKGPGSAAITAGSQTFMNAGLSTRLPRYIALKLRRTSQRGVRMRPTRTPSFISLGSSLYRGVAIAAGQTVVIPTP